MQAVLSSEYSSTPKYASFKTGWYPEWLEFTNGKKMCPSYAFIDDTINTASRMESNSEPMRINVSETTYNILKGKYSFIERETINVKGKGNMKMFFLDV